MPGSPVIRKTVTEQLPIPRTVIPSAPGKPRIDFMRRSAVTRLFVSHSISINRSGNAGCSELLVAANDSVPSPTALGVSLRSSSGKARCKWILRRLSFMRFGSSWPLHSTLFGDRSGLPGCHGFQRHWLVLVLSNECLASDSDAGYYALC